MHTNNQKVLVALSGGVDSSVCVYLLQQKGYEVAGIVLKMSPAHEQTVKDAQAVATQLGIQLYVQDMTKQFEESVIEYFTHEYLQGRTPNPCIVCNPTVKFQALIEAADRYGYDYVATGHYANLVHQDNKVLLARGTCKQRDQSYMLYRLGQRELSRLLFPLNQMEKTQVREIAKQAQLPSANKPDSQEICFIPDNHYTDYIESRTGCCPKGDFISPEGTVCGTHKGIIHYTVGQRKHLGIALGRPVFVKEIDPIQNRIYLANAGQEYYKKAIINQLSYPSGEPLSQPFEAYVKIRSVAPLAKAQIKPLEHETAEVIFSQPQRAVAKGQSIVMYDEQEIVIGGGFITEVFA